MLFRSLNKDQIGLGSIWSTRALFGDFSHDNAANIITEINSRFNIERNTGVGYMYTNEFVNKPIHPIVKKIRRGADSIHRLVPRGSTKPLEYWIPNELWPLILE